MGEFPTTRIKVGELTVDLELLRAWRNKREIHCTRMEFALIRLLVERSDEVVTRKEFLDGVWGYTGSPSTRTLDVHIALLRKKVESDSEKPVFIQTVRGVGYRLKKKHGKPDPSKHRTKRS